MVIILRCRSCRRRRRPPPWALPERVAGVAVLREAWAALAAAAGGGGGVGSEGGGGERWVIPLLPPPRRAASASVVVKFLRGPFPREWRALPCCGRLGAPLLVLVLVSVVKAEAVSGG